MAGSLWQSNNTFAAPRRTKPIALREAERNEERAKDFIPRPLFFNAFSARS
jgi:hypothetical protein